VEGLDYYYLSPCWGEDLDVGIRDGVWWLSLWSDREDVVGRGLAVAVNAVV
jgi:hypothetical protein